MKRILVFLVTFASAVASATFIQAQPGLPSNLRMAVYRIQTPGMTEGTASMFRNPDMSNYLITNAHVIQVREGDTVVWDSVMLYLNHRTKDGEVVSGPDFLHIRLKSETGESYVKKSKDADLVMIPVSGINTRMPSDSIVVTSMPNTFLPDDKPFAQYLKTTLIITSIGYPSKHSNSNCVTRYPEYRWGRLLSYDSDWINVSIPIVPGSSGSPVFLELEPDDYHLIGFATQRYTSGVGGRILSASIVKRMLVEKRPPKGERECSFENSASQVECVCWAELVGRSRQIYRQLANYVAGSGS